MGAASQIQWTDDTHNFWYGCTKVSPGCANCYAETLMDTRYGKVKWGKGSPRVRSKSFDLPLRWNKKEAEMQRRFPYECAKCGVGYSNPEILGTPWVCSQHGCGGTLTHRHRRRVFSLSLGDIGDPEVPFQWFNDAMVIVEKCANLDFLLLTKRPADFWERWQKVCQHWVRDNTRLPPNVWMGVSVEDQQRADERISILSRIPAAVRFVSYEPALGPVDFRTWLRLWSHVGGPCCVEKEGYHRLGETHPDGPAKSLIDWIIVGGESGPDARLFDVDWARDTVAQCKAAGVKVFSKQLGSVWAKENHSKDSKGGEMSDWPSDLQIREFPDGIQR